MKNLIKKTALVLSMVLLSQSAFAETEGGNAGGGGNAIRVSAVNQDELRSYTSHKLKTMLKLWLNAKEFQYESDPNSQDYNLGSLFRDGQGEIFKKLDQLKIELHTDKACYDGKEKRDASIYPQTEAGAICLSFDRVKKIWSTYDFEYRFAGLVMHELSHLVGANEEEAKRIEEKTSSELKSVLSNRYASRGWRSPVEQSADSTLTIANSFLNGVENENTLSGRSLFYCQYAQGLEQGMARTRQLFTANRDGINQSPQANYYPEIDQVSFANYEDTLKLIRAHDKARNILAWFCYGDSSEHFNGDDREVMKNAEFGRFSQLVKRLPPVRIVKGMQDAAQEAADIGKILQETTMNVSNMFLNNSVPVIIVK